MLTEALTTLLLMLWAAVGSTGATTYHAAPPPPGSVSTVGVTFCRADGTSDVYVNPAAPAVVTVHELAHALDCADDGVLNSSPFAVPDHRGVIRCPACDTEVERFAVWVHEHPEAATHALRLYGRLGRLTGVEPLAGELPR